MTLPIPVLPSSFPLSRRRISAGWYDSAIVRTDGTVTGWGGGVIPNITGAVDISYGESAALVLLINGTVTGFNGDYNRAFTDSLSSIVQVSSGPGQFLALKNDGTAVGWGYNYLGQADVPNGLNNVVQVCAGQDFSLALKNDGTVVGWGYNYDGVLDIPNNLTDVTKIAASPVSTFWVALRSNGTITGIGNNSYGQIDFPINLGGITNVAAGDRFTLALKSDGTITGWGNNDYGQVSAQLGLHNVVDIAAGIDWAFALLSNGEITGWGNGQGSFDKLVQTPLTPFSNSLTLDKPIIAAPFYVNSPVSDQGFPVTLSIQSGPATINQNLLTLNGTTGTVVLNATAQGNADYAAQNITTSFNVIKNYSVGATVNNLLLYNFGSIVNNNLISSGLPANFSVNLRNLDYNTQNLVISGISQVTGSFNGYIFTSGSNPMGDNALNVNLNILPLSNTGYLYAFGGYANYNEDVVPRNFLKTIVSKISAIQGYNLGVAIHDVYIPPDPVVVPPVQPEKPCYTRPNLYSFKLKNNSQVDCIDNFIFNSTVLSDCSGRIDKNLVFYYTGGSPGAYSTQGIVCTGTVASNLVPTGDVYFAGPVDFSSRSGVGTRLNIIKNNQVLAESDSWSRDYYSAFTGHGFTGTQNDAGVVLSTYGNQQNLYKLKYGVVSTGAPSGYLGTYRSSISLTSFDKQNLIPYQQIDANPQTQAWAVYNTYTGSGILNNSSNVFSYAIELVQKITYNYSISATGLLKSGTTIAINTPPPYVLYYTGNLLKQLECPIFGQCKQDDGPEDMPVELCWSGSDITGKEFQNYISGVKKMAYDYNHGNGHLAYDPKTYQSGSTASLVVSASGAPITSGMFNYITGNIVCEPFATGDSLNFNLYSFDYTGLYQKYHNSFPLYPTTGFTLTCPQDFTTAQDLTNVLNSRLNNISYPVWYPYDFLQGMPFGFYKTGSLMSFSLTNPTGKIPIISYISNRNYTSGFTIEIKTGNRENIKVTDDTYTTYQKSKISGYSLLVPDQIDLQAYDPDLDAWIVLDRQLNLYNKITGMSGKEFRVTGYNYDLPDLNTGVLSGTIDTSKAITGVPLNTGSTVEVFATGIPWWIDQGKLCPPFQGTHEIKVTWQSGAASGINPCPSTGDMLGECDYCCQWLAQQRAVLLQSGISGSGSGIVDLPLQLISDMDVGNTQCNCLKPYVILDEGTCWRCVDDAECPDGIKPPPVVRANYIRTGWTLDPDSPYLTCLLNNTKDLTQINFPMYRVVLGGLKGMPVVSDANTSLLQTSSFNVKAINLFSAQNVFQSGRIVTGNLTGNAALQQIYGKPYTAQIQGVARLPFTGDFNYSITNTGQKGQYVASNEIMLHVPTGDEINVKFMHSSGKLITNLTGLVNGTFSGSGIVSKTFDSYYFYDTQTNEISFEKTVSGTGIVLASGVVSTQASVLTPATVNKALAIGGFLTNASFYTELTTGGLYSGNMPNVPFFFNNVTGLCYLTGSVTGMSNSGYLTYNSLITGSPTGFAILDSPYYPFATGYINSTASILFNFNNINANDVLSINNKTILFNADTVNYPAPNFFSDIPTLINSINSNLLQFNCSAYSGSGNNVYLTSILSGDLGNSITIFSNSSGMVPSSQFFTGGQTFYPPFNINSGNVFSGFLNKSYAVTGYYTSNNSTGYLYGNIPTYQGFRNFTGVWNVATGTNNSFYNLTPVLDVNNNLIGYSGAIISNTLGVSAASIIQLRVDYNNYLNVNTSLYPSDFINLRISGLNFGPSGSGIQLGISGSV